jgi:preprotein translocase subunit Sec63
VLRVSRVKAAERASAARTNPRAAPAPRLVEAPDALDDEALRLKVKARRALVDEGDYFALLGVPREATGYDIRRSYTELRRQFDPGRVLRPNTLDLREDVDAIIDLLDEAYEILRDQGRRERYRRAIESTP